MHGLNTVLEPRRALAGHWLRCRCINNGRLRTAGPTAQQGICRRTVQLIYTPNTVHELAIGAVRPTYRFSAVNGRSASSKHAFGFQA